MRPSNLQSRLIDTYGTLCDENGLLLILDEVQCGYARTGKMWGYDWSGVKPDVAAIAKGMGESGVRSAQHAETLVRMFSPRVLTPRRSSIAVRLCLVKGELLRLSPVPFRPTTRP